MKRFVPVAPKLPLLLLVGGFGFAASSAAQEAHSPAAGPEPQLLPGCALPSAKLIAAAAPVNVQLRIGVAASGAVLSVEPRRSSGHPELDAAFVSAARACRFTAAAGAAAGESPPRDHKLVYKFEGGPAPLGIHGCFATEYPPMALRREEEGTARLLFRLPAGDAAPEVKLARSSGWESLDQHALLVAGSCLANAAVRAELASDKWYAQSITWVLH